MTLADRIVVLKDGQIMQVSSPRELYEHPVNVFFAEFIGSPKMNILPCTVEGGAFRLEGGRGGDAPGCDGAVNLGIRPEAIALGPAGTGQVDGVVDLVEYLGADNFLVVDCGTLGKLTVRVGGEEVIRVGDQVGLTFAEGKTHFFDAEGRALDT